jgi:hypothetical protein
MEGKHFIFDFETLGQDSSTCVAVNCAFTTFDAGRFQSKPFEFDELVDSMQFLKFDVRHQAETYGYKIEQRVLDWWDTQEPEVRKQIVPNKKLDIEVKSFIQQVIEYLKANPVSYWWTRSNTFDPVIMLRIARDTGLKDELESYLKYWAVRDTRTFIDAKTDFRLKDNGFIPFGDEVKFKKHDPLHDVAADIMRLQKLVRVGEGLE